MVQLELLIGGTRYILTKPLTVEEVAARRKSWTKAFYGPSVVINEHPVISPDMPIAEVPEE